MLVTFRVKKAVSIHNSIIHLDFLKAHMFLKTAGKAINTNSELNSGYNCITALYQS